MQKFSLSFDEILERKLGTGKYQWICLCILCLVDLNDGVEMVAMSLIMPIIKKEWDISNFWVEVLSSIFYLGMMLGALLTGMVADRRGRQKGIMYASLLQFIIGTSFALVNNLFFLLIFRFIYGFIYGFSLPLTVSMIAEIVPVIYRGKCITFMNFNITIGRIYALILAYFILEDYHTGNWRLLMIICSLSSLIVAFGVKLYVKESPRFLISIGNFDEGFKMIDYIGNTNKGDEYTPLTIEEKIAMKNFQENTFNASEQASVKVLFSKKCLPITLRLWVIVLSLIFFSLGSLVILPFIFSETQKGFGTMMIAVAGELPSVILSFILIDLKNFGRKNSLTICCFILGIFNFLAYLFGATEFFSTLLSIQRFFLKVSFSMFVPLTSELYPTNYRTVAYGYATSIGRLGATISPYVLLPLLSWNLYLPFVVFGILNMISAYASHSIKFETAGKPLDEFLVGKQEKYTIIH